MDPTADLVELPTGGPPHPPDARVVGPVAPGEPMTVTVMLRPRSPQPTDAEIEEMGRLPISGRHYAGREAFEADHGADPADLKAVEDFARGAGLTVAEADAARRRVILTGRAADISAAFGVKLDRFQHAGGSYRAPSSPIHVPAGLAPIVEGVLGLDDRPAARPHP